MDNDFSFHNDRVSGIVHDKDGWPRVHDKARILRDYMSKKGDRPENGVLVVHGPEERSMARMFGYRIIVPKKGSCKELRRNAKETYQDLESVPGIVANIFDRQRIL